MKLPRSVWIPAALFLLHAALYRGWLVDDAAISLAYAQNLAGGHGLVAQPGAAPVEGYSNPLWVALLASGYLLGGLGLPLSAKLLGAALSLSCLALLAGLARRVGGEELALWTGVLVSLNPAVVLWCTSGLENPLYLLGVLGLCELSRRACGGCMRAAGLAGVVAAGVALTRPEGLCFAVLPLLAAVLDGGALRLREGERRFALGLLVPFGGHLLFRLAYFGDLLPNTYYAKGSPGLSGALHTLVLGEEAWGKLRELVSGMVGPEAAGLLLLGLPLLVLAYGRRRGGSPAGRQAGLAAGLALAVYLLLPPDWMGELRFGTPAVCLGTLVLLGALAPARPGGPRLAALVVLLAAAPALRWRALRSSLAAPVSVDYVRRAYVERFDRWADALGADEASVLLPDVGAMVLESRLRVHDLGGLCDRDIARLLHGPRAALREHVLGTLRPEFMHLDPFWAPELMLGRDPRFESEYVSLYRYPPHPDFPFEDAVPGYHVRRDLAERSPEVMAALRAEPHGYAATLRRPRPGPLVTALALLPLPRRAGWLPPPEPAASRLPGRRHRREPTDGLPEEESPSR